jgi:hypothetical protein
MADKGERLIEILGEWGTQLQNDLVDSLERNNVVGSGGSASKLAGSIRMVFLKDEMGIGITMADYWEYVELGRKKGKKPPIDNLIAWIKWKGFALKPITKPATKSVKAASYEKQIKSMAFAIATNIGKYGTIKREGYKGTKFVDEVINDGRVEELAKIIADEIGIEIKVSVADILKE